MNKLIKFLSTPGELICVGGALVVLVLLAQSLTGGFFYLIVVPVIGVILALIIYLVWHLLDEPLLGKFRRYFEKSE
jgi:hypothetical protein